MTCTRLIFIQPWRCQKYTKPGEGVEILENVPCDVACLPQHNPNSRNSVQKVQRTSKRYYIPDFITSHLTKDSVVLRESSFNGFPNFRTVVTAESGTTGEFTIDTLCMTDDDANKDNVFKLPQIILDKRSVINIDIVNDALPPELVKEGDDPKKVLGLKDDWNSSFIPMVVYKLVFVKSNDEIINTLIRDNLRTMFNLFHRKLVCSQDRWIGLNIKDIRTMEDDTKDLLDQRRAASDLPSPASG